MSLRSKPSADGSVFKSQEPVDRLQVEVNRLSVRLKRVKRQLEKAIEAHREQIRLSLSSPDPSERAAAESIAVWWDVISPPAP